MQIEVHSLASGSSGNALLIKAGDRGLLIDAGLSGRRLRALLSQRGIHAGMLDGVLLTHEHHDHIRGVPELCTRIHAPLVANRATLHAAGEAAEPCEALEISTGSDHRIGPFYFRSFPVPHDAVEPVGYVVTVGSARIAYATDAGCVTPEIRMAVRDASLIVLESNHDVDMLRLGPYPAFMKHRVSGNRGHLSNGDAAEILTTRLDEGGPACIWLAHLSAVNNSPAFARRYVETAIRTRIRTPLALDIALRDRPSVVWRPGTMAFQQTLF